MNTKKFMARRIIVERGDSMTEYPLSIATAVYDDSGVLLSVDVAPYEREIDGVEYVDGTLTFTL